MSVIKWVNSSMLILILTVTLTGCWNRRELPELAIISAMGIDKAVGSNEYILSFQVIKPQEISRNTIGEGSPSNTIVYRSTGKSIFEAIRKTSDIISRQLFFSHVQFIVIGESLARQGISDVFDFFERSHESRMSSYFLVAREMKAEDIISAISPLERVQARAVIGELELTKENWSHTVLWQVDDIIRSINDPGIDPTISGIRLTGKVAESSSKSNIEKTQPKSNIEIKGVALFKGDKLIGWLDNDYARGLVRLTNTMKSTVTLVECEDKKGEASIETVRSKSKIRMKMVNGKPTFQVNILEEGIVSELNCPLPLDKDAAINELEHLWKTKIEEEVEGAVQETKKKLVDPTGFGLFLSRYHPKVWGQWSESWDSLYTNCPVTIRVEATIERTGMVRKSFKK